MHNLACQYFKCDDFYFCSACLGTILTPDVDPLMSKLWRTEGKKAVAQRTRELSWFTTLQSEKTRLPVIFTAKASKNRLRLIL